MRANLPVLGIFRPSLSATLPLGLPVSSDTRGPRLKEETYGGLEQGNNEFTAVETHFFSLF